MVLRKEGALSITLNASKFPLIAQLPVRSRAFPS